MHFAMAVRGSKMRCSRLSFLGLKKTPHHEATSRVGHTTPASESCCRAPVLVSFDPQQRVHGTTDFTGLRKLLA